MKSKTKFPFFVYAIFFVLPAIFVLLWTKNLDNDLWYLLSEGRYILNNGIYHIDPLSMHTGLEVIVQNWLSASFLWIVFNLFGKFGIILLVLICNFFICYFLYKICMLISDGNTLLSLIIMIINDILLALYYIVSRPQIFSFILLLALIYILELYIKKKDKKYLIWIPILSLIEVNMHASLWWMMFLFMLPYVIDSFKLKHLPTEGYERKPLLTSILIAFLVGFINPYGYKAITFILTSFGDLYMHQFILELQTFSFDINMCKLLFVIIMAFWLVCVLIKKNDMKLRYICLFCGTTILAFISIKSMSHFLLVSIFPFAYMFKDVFPRDFSGFPKYLDMFLNYGYGLVFIFIIFIFILSLINTKNITFDHNSKWVMMVMDKYYSKEDSTIYTTFNDGGYIEYRGYKPYIDPRAEVYLKNNNGKDNIFKENFLLSIGAITPESFLKKYNFTHLIIDGNNPVLSYVSNNDKGYICIYVDPYSYYALFVREDLLTDEVLEKAKNNSLLSV